MPPTAGLDPQFSDVLDVLRQCGVEYWVDAGTLLGVMREGGLVDWDRDIDVGCWSSELPALKRVTEAMVDRGYSVRKNVYGEQLQRLYFRPSLRGLSGGARTVDVSIYRRHGEVAWNATNCVLPPPRARFSLGWFVERPVREAFVAPWKRHRYRSSRYVPLLGLQMDVRTWVVPARFFSAFQVMDVGGRRVPIPGEVDDYLALRYGDWRTPRSEWNYCEDDGALRALPPHEALGRR